MGADLAVLGIGVVIGDGGVLADVHGDVQVKSSFYSPHKIQNSPPLPPGCFARSAAYKKLAPSHCIC